MPVLYLNLRAASPAYVSFRCACLKPLVPFLFSHLAPIYNECMIQQRSLHVE
jgi:hypothetical protein